MVRDGEGYRPVASSMTGFGQGVFAVGGRVWFGDGSALRLLRFAEGAFTPLGMHAGRFARVWVTPSAVFSGESTRVVSFAPDDDDLVPRAVGTTTGGGVRDVWSDGVHLFAACGAGGVEVFAEGDGALVSLDQTPTSGTESLGVVGDGEYIFVADGAAGLRALSGFACTRRR